MLHLKLRVFKMNEWCMLVSIIIFLFLTGLKRFPSSLYTLLTSLGVTYLSIPTSFILWCNSALVNNTNLFRQTWRCKSLINLFYNIPQCSAEEIVSRLGATFQLFQPLTLVPVSGNFCDNWLWAHFVATRNILKGTIILMVTHDLNPISCAMQKLHYSFSAQWTRKQ